MNSSSGIEGNVDLIESYLCRPHACAHSRAFVSLPGEFTRLIQGGVVLSEAYRSVTISGVLGRVAEESRSLEPTDAVGRRGADRTASGKRVHRGAQIGVFDLFQGVRG